MLVPVNQSKHALCSRNLRDTSKMADIREDDLATFQFIDDVQNCPDLWDDTKYKRKKLSNGRVLRYTGQISTDIRFRPNLCNI